MSYGKTRISFTYHNAWDARTEEYDDLHSAMQAVHHLHIAHGEHVTFTYCDDGVLIYRYGDDELVGEINFAFGEEPS